jgi:hypothetical protein
MLRQFSKIRLFDGKRFGLVCKIEVGELQKAVESETGGLGNVHPQVEKKMAFGLKDWHKIWPNLAKKMLGENNPSCLLSWETLVKFGF